MNPDVSRTMDAGKAFSDGSHLSFKGDSLSALEELLGSIPQSFKVADDIKTLSQYKAENKS